MPVPAFGFSFGDFVNAIGLINDIRRALKDTGGSEDELGVVLQDLQQLEAILTQLDRGSWGDGCDLAHVNAVRGLASTCKAPLVEFLDKLTASRGAMRGRGDGVRSHLRSGFKKAEWAILLKDDVECFRQIVISKTMTLTLLMVVPMA